MRCRNDPEMTARAAEVFKAAFGANAIEEPLPATASEDYSQFVMADVPRSFFFGIGIYPPDSVAASINGGPQLPANHSPYYAPVPEPTIRTGVEAMVLAVLSTPLAK